MRFPVAFQHIAPAGLAHPLQQAPVSNFSQIPLVFTPNGFPQLPNEQIQIASPNFLIVYPAPLVMYPTTDFSEQCISSQTGHFSPSDSVESVSRLRSSSPKPLRSPPRRNEPPPRKRQKTSLEYAFEAKARNSTKNNRARRRAMKENGWVSRRPDFVQRPKIKRYGFRSKQNMIDKVHDSLVRKYTELGILAPIEEVLRGDTTIRIHVKKYKALVCIEEALECVEANERVTIQRISIPLAIKNEFQKKGFLVYIQVSDVEEVPIAQSVLREFEVFQKCHVAPKPVEAEKSSSTKSSKPIDATHSADNDVENLAIQFAKMPGTYKSQAQCFI